MKAKIMGVAFAALLALGLAACSNMDSGSVNGMMLAMTNQPSTTRSVSIHVGGDVNGLGNGISATIMPGKDIDTITGAFKFTLDQLTCVLTGKSHLGGTVSQIISPNPSSGDVSLDLNAAIWELTLTAYPNTGWKSTVCGDGTTESGTPYADVPATAGKTPALVATTSVDLRNGGQTVTFNLSATGLTGAGGKVTIGGEYKDKSVVTNYVVGLYNINDNTPRDVLGNPIAEVKKDSLTPSATDVAFTADFNNVAAGSYRAAVALYNSEGTQVGYWSDIVVLNPTVPSLKTNIYIDNLLEPPVAPENLTAYLVPSSYDVKNSGYYDVRLVWEDKSTNENYFRIKLDRYGVTNAITYPSATGTAVAGTVYYKNNTGTPCDPQPSVGADVTSFFVASNAVTKKTSDLGYPKYLSAVATAGTPADEKYTESVFYSSAFENSSLLAGSQSVVLRLETGYIYEVKVVAHNAMGDSEDKAGGTDTTGVSTGAKWTERVAGGANAKTIMEGLTPACPVDDSTPPATDPTKYMPYDANDGTGLKGINLMSIKYLLGSGGRKYEASNKFAQGPLFDYFRYGNDTAVLSKKVTSGATGSDFYPAILSTPPNDPIETYGDIANAKEYPIIVKVAGTTTSSSISDFAYWADPSSSDIYDPAIINAENVTVVAQYGSSTVGNVSVEDLQDIDPVRVLVQYNTTASTAKSSGTTLKPTDSDASGKIEEAELVTVDAKSVKFIYLAVNDTPTGSDARTYSKFKFLVGGNECYGINNEYTFDTSNMESGTYHIVVSAYYAPQDKWFGYECSFKVSR